MTLTEKKNLLKWFYESNFNYNLIYDISLKVNGIPPVWIKHIEEIAAIYIYIKIKTVY